MQISNEQGQIYFDVDEQSVELICHRCGRPMTVRYDSNHMPSQLIVWPCFCTGLDYDETDNCS